LYVGDTGGQVWRIDLGDQIGAAGDAGSSGYVFADVGCGSTSATERIHNTSGICPAGTTRQDLRKFFYPPDVAMVKDVTFSNTPNYDLVAIGSGDREDPLDLLTTLNYTPVQEGVHNRMYAFRDYNYKTGKPEGTFPPSVITEKDMYDATDNLLGTLTGSALDDEINNNVKDKKGWYIDLMEKPDAVTLVNGLTTQWVGEKVLAKPVIFDGTLFFTTFIPANDSTAINTCKANEGEGRYYEVNYLNATPVANLRGGNDLDRYGIAGGGIPSEVIIVIREDGVSGLVGTSGGAKQVDPGGGTNRYKTFWWDE
jgi:type IV pilus assembly protein PilY1